MVFAHTCPSAPVGAAFNVANRPTQLNTVNPSNVQGNDLDPNGMTA